MDGFDGVLSEDRFDRNDLEERIVEKTKYTKTVLRNSRNAAFMCSYPQKKFGHPRIPKNPKLHRAV